MLWANIKQLKVVISSALSLIREAVHCMEDTVIQNNYILVICASQTNQINTNIR